MKKGEIWWACLPEPKGSGPGFRRPVLIVSSNAFNSSRINTVLAAVITSNLRLSAAPGNVSLPRKISRLGKDSVINVSQIITVDKSLLTERVIRIPSLLVNDTDAGLRLVFGLSAV